MLGTAKCREFGLEDAHFRSKHELAMIENAGDRRIDGLPKTAALRRQVNERYGRWIGS
jgi:hypothetical protein